MARVAPTPDERVIEYWNERHARSDHGTHDNFLSHPLVQGYVSIRAFGNLTPHMDAVVTQIRERTPPGARIYSPGCGPADKEIALATAIPDRHFVASDITPQILAGAREAAEKRGLRNLEFRVADFNQLALEARSYDAVLGLGAIHHVEALEHFWSEVHRGLKPGGVVLAQEFVGPNRMQWRPAQIEHGNRVLRELVPEAHKVHHREVVATPVEEMLRLDPSEAVRSEDLLPTCKAAGFEILGYASAGCALLQPVLMNQVHTFDPRNWQHNLVLVRLFEEEDRLMREGVLGDDFAMWVAAPR